MIKEMLNAKTILISYSPFAFPMILYIRFLGHTWINFNFMLIFFVDILVYNVSFEYHLHHLKTFFNY